MIIFEKTKIYGWESAVRGMRNPMNSWKKSDTVFRSDGSLLGGLGENDYKLMKKLADGGQTHGKYLRMITVTTDIVAPLYWWKEFDTYKVGTVSNSCSTMHKIHSKEFILDDFSTEHLINDVQQSHFVPEAGTVLDSIDCMIVVISMLNYYRKLYLETKDEKYWWQIIQLLPSSYNQKRTVQLNYAVLKNIYPDRKNHKLCEWVDFCWWITRLPYPELIIGEQDEK